VEAITNKVLALVHGGKSNLSKGGMDSKLRAAKTVSAAGCAVVIANGRQGGVIGSIIRGEDVGTLVLASAF
jgi:glutamate 5-kinase